MCVSFWNGRLKVAGSEEGTPPQGARGRTRQLMLDTATRMMQAGQTPSVTAACRGGRRRRARTAYRVFPSQAALVGAVVDKGLGPILSWSSDFNDAEARVADLLDTSMPRILEFEATFKAALKLTLEQWAEQQAGTASEERPFRRGHRVELLQQSIAPLRGVLTSSVYAPRQGAVARLRHRGADHPQGPVGPQSAKSSRSPPGPDAPWYVRPSPSTK